MLYFVGKDVFRWLDQCRESTSHIPGLAGAGLEPQSFAGLLTGGPPPSVKEKLIRWGVADHCAIFSRAIGLHALFAEPPPFDGLSSGFLQNYHRYSDALFRSFMESQPHRIISAANFRFEIYASGEYTKMLESEWAE